MTKSPTTDAIIAADWHKLEDDYVPASAYWRIATHAKEIEERLTDMQADKTCQWSEDEDGNWDTSCSECFAFTDGGPTENKARWCCYCGGKIIENKHNTNEP